MYNVTFFFSSNDQIACSKHIFRPYFKKIFYTQTKKYEHIFDFQLIDVYN